MTGTAAVVVVVIVLAHNRPFRASSSSEEEEEATQHPQQQQPFHRNRRIEQPRGTTTTTTTPPPPEEEEGEEAYGRTAVADPRVSGAAAAAEVRQPGIGGYCRRFSAPLRNGVVWGEMVVRAAGTTRATSATATATNA